MKDSTILRAISGVVVGAGAILLIFQEQYAVAAGLLGSMVGFFAGESNGRKEERKEWAK